MFEPGAQIKNRHGDRSLKIKPLRLWQSAETVVQRSARQSGGFEHHRYGWGGQGSLVRSGWRVMAVRACFQCRAAGWHSEEDNDVLVSHRITQHTCSQSAGAGGRPGCGGPQTAPTGTQTVPQAWPLVFPLFSRAPAQCRKEKTKLDLLTFQMFRGGRYTSSREHLFQLGCRSGRWPFSQFSHLTSFSIREDLMAHTFFFFLF